MIELLKNWPVGQPVPAISLRQPWASAVVDYSKDVENRSRWPFKHRGPIIIHASATKPTLEDFETFLKRAKDDDWGEEDLPDISSGTYPVELFPHGCILGLARLVDVFTPASPPPDDHEVNKSPWKSPDAGAWLYVTDPISVQDVPFKGFVGLFSVPYEIASALEP